MPKKTKSKVKPKPSAKPKVQPKARSTRLMGLRRRKELITDTMEALVADVPDQQQLDVVEHICDIGIDLLGLVTGVDATNALVVFPDDGMARLIQAISEREAETQIPCEEIIERLLQQLKGDVPLVLN